MVANVLSFALKSSKVGGVSQQKFGPSEVIFSSF